MYQKCVCFVVAQYYAGFRSLAALPSRLCSSLLLPLARSVLQHFLLVLSRGRLQQLLPLLRSSCTRPLKTKKKQDPYNKPHRRRSGPKEAPLFGSCTFSLLAICALVTPVVFWYCGVLLLLLALLRALVVLAGRQS